MRWQQPASSSRASSSSSHYADQPHHPYHRPPGSRAVGMSSGTASASGGLAGGPPAGGDRWGWMVEQGHKINPCNSKLHPAVIEEGIEPEPVEEVSVQEAYTPESSCFGCGPTHPDGLHLRSFRIKDGLEARVSLPSKYCAFPGIINGGILSTLMVCGMAALPTLAAGCEAGCAVPTARGGLSAAVHYEEARFLGMQRGRLAQLSAPDRPGGMPAHPITRPPTSSHLLSPPRFSHHTILGIATHLHCPQDCHGNWTAAVALMDRSFLPNPPLTLTASMLVGGCTSAGAPGGMERGWGCLGGRAALITASMAGCACLAVCGRCG